MRRCVRWIPLVAFVAILPALAADDEPKKPTDADKKGEMKKDDKGDLPAKPEPKPEPKQAKKEYTEVTTLDGVVKKIDSKSSEIHIEHMVGGGRYMNRKTEELTLADDAKFLTKIHPEVVGDD